MTTKLMTGTTGRVKKVAPLEFFADFSQVAENFNINFYTFTQRFRQHFQAKQNLIDFNNYKVTTFLASPLGDFHVFTNVHTEDLYDVQMKSIRLLLMTS